jgi:hypothetical protein
MLHLAYKSVSKEGTKMRKILLATVAAATLFTATAANADYYGHRHGGYRGGGGGWAAPLIGGLIVGGIVGGALAQPQPYYAAPPAYRTECRIVPVYDRYGYYVGDRRECYQVPNY